MHLMLIVAWRENIKTFWRFFQGNVSELENWFQVQMHTSFHRFMEISQIFPNKN